MNSVQEILLKFCLINLLVSPFYFSRKFLHFFFFSSFFRFDAIFLLFPIFFNFSRFFPSFPVVQPYLQSNPVNQRIQPTWRCVLTASSRIPPFRPLLKPHSMECKCVIDKVNFGNSCDAIESSHQICVQIRIDCLFWHIAIGSFA